MNNIKRTSIAVAYALMSVNVYATDDIFEGLTDSEHFRTYPYIDKAYQKQRNKQYDIALKEVDHALIIAPNHVPFLKFAYQLALSAGKPIETQLKYLTEMPMNERGNDILNVWLDNSKNGKFYTKIQLKKIADTLTMEQMQSLFANNLYSINKYYGAAKALQWSYDKPRKYKSLVTLRYEGYQLYSEKQYAKAQSILDFIYQSYSSDQTDLKYLALSILMQGKEAKALTYASKLTLPTDQQDFYNQYVEHLLVTYQYIKARRELNRLHDRDELSDKLIMQRDYLNSLDETAINEFVQMTPCLKQTMNDISSGNVTQAKVILMQCDSQIDSTMWIKLADKLGLHSQIEQIYFEKDSAKKLKTLVLLTHYKNQKSWSKIINLLKNDYDLELSPRELAYAYSKVKQFSKSANIYFQNYKKDHHNSDLVYAVFNALQSSSGDKLAASMIEYGLQINKQELLADQKIVNNILDIAQRNVALFSPQIIANVNSKNVVLSPSIWQIQHQCHMINNLATNYGYLNQAIAYCLANSDPLKAAKQYQTTIKGSPSQQQSLVLAQWFSKANSYKVSDTYWHNAVRNTSDFNKLSPYLRYLYIYTMNKVGRSTLANQYWLVSNFDKKNEEWWQLGIDIAEKIDNKASVISRIEQGVYHTQSSALTQKLAEYIIQNNDRELAKNLFEIDKTGDSSVLLGYQTYQKDPELAQQAFANAYQHPKHKKDVNMTAQYADIVNKNGDTILSSQLYKAAIDQELTKPVPDNQLLIYLQRSHKNINLDWKYNVAGWIGTDQQQAMPGVSSATGNYFLFGEAKYYFEYPWLPRSAVSITTLSSGGFTHTLSNNTTDLDLSYQVQPIASHETYLKAGIRQQVIGDDHKTRPYVRVSSNVLSIDKWSKEWKHDLNYWLYQNIYADGLLYLDNTDDYILFGRYEIGSTFKMENDYQQRLTPYTFIQWAYDNDNTSTVVGLGASWNWKSYNTKYNGLDVDSEVGLEWQHTLQSSQVNKLDNAVLLRFSLFF